MVDGPETAVRVTNTAANGPKIMPIAKIIWVLRNDLQVVANEDPVLATNTQSFATEDGGVATLIVVNSGVIDLMCGRT